MDNSKTQLKANIFNQKLRPQNKKKSFETSQTINETLPSINNQSKSQQKVNVMRHQLNDTKSQVILMEAKLKNLRKIKEKYQNTNKQNLTKIEFMNTIKERVKNDFQYKQQVRQQRQQSLEMLKQQTESLRQSLVNEKRNAEDNLYNTKLNEAEELRRQHKHHQYLIKKLKEMDMIENSKKVQKIKEFHETSSSRLKDFHESRINFSRSNYQKKVFSALKEKEKSQSFLQRLKQEQKRILSDVKQSQKTMLTSLYSLQSINPESKRKIKFNESNKSLNYYHNDDNYDIQEFEN